MEQQNSLINQNKSVRTLWLNKTKMFSPCLKKRISAMLG
jgi:hypothetical protein